MKQLRSVTIENFQSHKHTSLTLAPGTNVIVGTSDSGKSAILRALNWVVTNRPLGDAFRSDWGGDTRVVVATTDGHVVERVRSASRNDYVVDGAVLTAFGTEVPERVLEVLPLDAFSFQYQQDAPFLLAASPGEAARLLNRAASLDEIDLVLSNLNRTQLGLNRELKANRTQVAAYKEQLTEYEDLPALEERLTTIEQADAAFRQQMALLTHKQRLLARATTLEEALAGFQLLTRAEVLLKLLNEAVPQWNAAQQAVARLAERLARAEVVQTQLRAGHVPREADQLAASLDEALPVWRGARDRLSRFQFAVRQGTGLQDQLAQSHIQLEALTAEYNRLAPDECPLCGNPMPKGEV